VHSVGYNKFMFIILHGHTMKLSPENMFTKNVLVFERLYFLL